MGSEEVRQLVGWGITKALELAYRNHHYTVGGAIHKQEDGGPQGLNTAVEASEVYMLEFDRKFLILLRGLGVTILLYLRYVDDITAILPPIKPGWFFHQESKEMRFDPSHQYAALEEDKRTMLVLQDIANTVDPNLSFTVDCPSDNPDGRLPILDLKFWVEGSSRIRHTFYKKPMAPERTIMARSALSRRIKRDTLFSEGMRRLSALDRHTTLEERN